MRQTLYGTSDFELSKKGETIDYIAYKHRDVLDAIRHMLTIPHLVERKTRLVYLSLKEVYICLSCLALSEEGKLPRTRKQTMAYFRKKKKNDRGIRLFRILDSWDSYKEDASIAPDLYLFLLGEFFRKLQI